MLGLPLGERHDRVQFDRVRGNAGLSVLEIEEGDAGDRSRSRDRLEVRGRWLAKGADHCLASSHHLGGVRGVDRARTLGGVGELHDHGLGGVARVSDHDTYL